MKKSLKLMLAFCCMFVFVESHAQVTFGVKAGLNVSTMSFNYSGGAVPSTKSLVGFHVGLISEISLAESLVLQPGVLFSTKGTKIDNTGDPTITPLYIEVPVNFMYKANIGGPKLLLFAGPYFGYGIGGKAKSDGESTDISYGSGEDNVMKAFDLGVNIGAGIEVSKLQITLQYGIGLSNLSPVTTNDTSYKNRVVGISVGYLFGK